MTRVLVAEDEEILRMLIVDSLEELELDVDEAEDGEMALAKLNGNPYDLVILDYMMPRLTGIDVLRQMDEGRKKNLSVLMLTARVQESDKRQAISAGVQYFMPKPFSPLELIATVREILSGSADGGER